MVVHKTLTAAALGSALIIAGSSVAFAQSKINCTCRFAGKNFPVGDIACIRGKLSRCSFVLNNTSWKTIADSCPQVSAPGLQQNLASNADITIMARMHSQFSIK